MTPVDRLLAESEISRLIIRYAELNDAGDFPALVALFIEDGVFVRPSGGDPVIGREAILQSYLSRPPRLSRHLIANISVIFASGSEAACRSAILLYTAAPGPLPAAAGPGLLGGFADKVVKTKEGWRFAERRGWVDIKIGGA
jgi:ketosteroid isomerase-like protein